MMELAIKSMCRLASEGWLYGIVFDFEREYFYFILYTGCVWQLSPAPDAYLPSVSGQVNLSVCSESEYNQVTPGTTKSKE